VLKSGVPPGACQGTSVKDMTVGKVRDQIKAWRVSAVVAVTTPDSLLAKYLTSLFGPAAVVTGDVIAWRIPSTGDLRGNS
jgi:hypothetical protein